jgi:hypothetical protein
MGQPIARRYRALAAIVSGLIGACAGSAAQAADCDICPPPGSETQGQQVTYAVDNFSEQVEGQQPNGQRRVFFVGPLVPPPAFFPSAPQSRFGRGQAVRRRGGGAADVRDRQNIPGGLDRGT